MHICLLSQFYPPEVGAAAIRLSRLAASLVADGHKVTVLTSVPNYPSGIIPPEYRGKLFEKELLDGVEVHRVWVHASPHKRNIHRLLNQLTFMVMSALKGIFISRPDVILVESHPLFVCITGGFLSLLKHAPIVLNVSDLWPESAIATGALRPDSPIVKVAERVERWAYCDASHIVGMTEGVVAGINKVHQRPDRVTLIPNAVDLDSFRPNLAKERADVRSEWAIGDRLTIVHIGNMSLTYDFDLLLDAAAALPDFTFVFIGSGSRLQHIKDRIEQEHLGNVLLTGVLPHHMMPSVWAAADICIIALGDHSVASGTRPAKMYEAMAAGIPIVAAITGEGQALLEESGAGIATPLGDLGAMIVAISDYASHPTSRSSAATAGRIYAETHLSPERVKLSYMQLFEQVKR